jgi:hypothetical protein
MSTIEVTPTDEDGTQFSVTVTDDDCSATNHEVTVLDADWERFGRGYSSPEELVEASFAFLLEREPKESILRSFELDVIARYFSEYPEVITARASS